MKLSLQCGNADVTLPVGRTKRPFNESENAMGRVGKRRGRKTPQRTPSQKRVLDPPSSGTFSTPLKRCPCSVFPVQKSKTEHTRSSFEGVWIFFQEGAVSGTFSYPHTFCTPPPSITPTIGAVGRVVGTEATRTLDGRKHGHAYVETCVLACRSLAQSNAKSDSVSQAVTWQGYTLEKCTEEHLKSLTPSWKFIFPLPVFCCNLRAGKVLRSSFVACPLCSLAMWPQSSGTMKKQPKEKVMGSDIPWTSWGHSCGRPASKTSGSRPSKPCSLLVSTALGLCGRICMRSLESDGRNRVIVIAESLARVIAAIRITCVHWQPYFPPQDTRIGPHRPCVCCFAIWIARLAFIRATFVRRGCEFPPQAENRCDFRHTS